MPRQNRAPDNPCLKVRLLCKNVNAVNDENLHIIIVFSGTSKVDGLLKH